jgi:hypothetical protein
VEVRKLSLATMALAQMLPDGVFVLAVHGFEREHPHQLRNLFVVHVSTSVIDLEAI